MGKKLAQMRKKQGMTQAQLAEASGVSRSTIANMERGAQRVIKSKTLEKLAVALCCDVGDIFFDQGV